MRCLSFSLIVTLLTHCDSTSVDRTRFQEAPNTSNIPTEVLPTEANISRPHLLNLKYKSLAEPNRIQLDFTWGNSFAKQYFGIYRLLHSKVASKRIALIAPGQTSFTLVLNTLENEFLTFFAAGRRENGALWLSPLVHLQSPSDLEIKFEKTYRTKDSEARDRVFLRERSRYIFKGQTELSGSLRVKEELVAENASIEIGDRLQETRTEIDPVFLRYYSIEAKRARGNLVIYANGQSDKHLYNGSTSDSPALFLRVIEPTDLKVQVVQTPADDKGVKRPICIIFAGKPHMGCGADWDAFVESLKRGRGR